MTDASSSVARAELYSLLSSALSYPREALRHELASGDIVASLREAAMLLKPSGALAEAVRGLESATEALRDDMGALEGEHTALFERQVASPPNETSYGASREFGGMQDMADVASFYAAFGFKISDEAKQLPDHVCVELEFLAVLCAKEAYARENGWADKADLCARAREKFVREHIGRWFAAFAAKVRERARAPFYPAVVTVGEAVLALEMSAAASAQGHQGRA